MSTNYRDPAPAGSYPGLSSRADRAVSWVGWHLVELTGVVGSAAVAVTVTPWAWIAAGVVTGGWAAHEVRVARARTAGTAADRDLPVLPPAHPEPIDHHDHHDRDDSSDNSDNSDNSSDDDSDGSEVPMSREGTR